MTNNGGTSVSQYSIDQTTGALTSITTAIASGSSFPLGIAVDPTGRFVYVANRNNSTVSQYLINQITGALTTITTAIALPASAGPIGVTVDPTGRFVYVVNEYFDTVNQLLINQATGALTTITTAIASGDRPVTVIVDPTGRFVYVVNQHGFGGNQPGSISQYSINNFSAGQSIISSPVNSTNTQTGALQVVGGVGVGGNLNVGGTLSVAGSTSGSITLQAGATPSSQTYTLPSAYPAANGYALTSTTGGVLSWDTVATLPTQTSNIGRILTTDGTTASWITPASSRLKLLTNSTGTVSHGFSDGPVWRHSSISANFTANFNGVPTTEGTVLTVTLQLVQGATPYMPTAVQVEGVTAGSILWFGGVSTGNANKTNVVIFTMIRSSSPWAVLGEVKSYG